MEKDWASDKPRPKWDAWLRDPSGFGIDVARTLPRKEAIRWTKAELLKEILETYENLFPLVLLATSDNPMPEIEEYLEGPEGDSLNPSYSLNQLAQDTSYDVSSLATWLRALHRKGQAIIYGPPGTGKTFLAERLARHLVQESEGIVDLIQFHPAYAYEDFHARDPATVQWRRTTGVPTGARPFPGVLSDCSIEEGNVRSNYRRDQ